MKRILLLLSFFQVITLTSEAKIGPALKPAATTRVQALVDERGVPLPRGRIEEIVAQVMEKGNMRELKTMATGLINKTPEVIEHDRLAAIEPAPDDFRISEGQAREIIDNGGMTIDGIRFTTIATVNRISGTGNYVMRKPDGGEATIRWAAVNLQLGNEIDGPGVPVRDNAVGKHLALTAFVNHNNDMVNRGTPYNVRISPIAP